jgi:NTE family protein
MIKHLVINGGGPTGLISYGAAKYLEQHEYFNINDIKSIYGASIGSLIGVLISLKYEWNVIDDYITKRPWEKVFQIGAEDLLNIFYTKGIVPFNMIELILKDLLEAKDLSTNVTLKEFYEYNNIDIYMTVVELNTFEKELISHKTHPDLSLITAIQMSTAVPIMFKPVLYEGKCYIDGGILCNYPLQECLDIEKCDKSEILGFRNEDNTSNKIENANLFDEKTSLIDYLTGTIEKVVTRLHKAEMVNHIEIPNEVQLGRNKKVDNYLEWFAYFTDSVKRNELVEYGIQSGWLFLQNHSMIHSHDSADSDGNVSDGNVSDDNSVTSDIFDDYDFTRDQLVIDRLLGNILDHILEETEIPR